ncbi:cytochrome c3 family protein [Limisalsivibrio acetivorans]|uniref:cytochrome c3 family protein n=1 Tax=Limisalsivibrio acetivorans TaxID=1304888 RepID=UPI0003B33869|nr:cytochrome c3 family protein [Limisalsivibrio acetivorans]
MMRFITYILVITAAVIITACGGGSGDSGSPLSESRTTAPQLNEPAAHGGGIGWESDNCMLCHPAGDLKDIHEYSRTLGDSFTEIDGYDTGVCFYCHGSNGVEGITAGTYRCTHCHTDSKLTRSADLFDGHMFHDVNGDDEYNNEDCLVCHDFSDMDGRIEMDIDFTQSGSKASSTTEFCLNCHDGNGNFGVIPPSPEHGDDNIYNTYIGTGETEEEKRYTADAHGFGISSGAGFGELRGTYSADMEIPCTACHEVHTSPNSHILSENGSNAELTDDTASVADISVYENNYTELCSVCHFTEGGAETGNGLVEVVHDGPYSSNCSDCHYHGSGDSGLF